jgi:hypothetical protein
MINESNAKWLSQPGRPFYMCSSHRQNPWSWCVIWTNKTVYISMMKDHRLRSKCIRNANLLLGYSTRPFQLQLEIMWADNNLEKGWPGDNEHCQEHLRTAGKLASILKCIRDVYKSKAILLRAARACKLCTDLLLASLQNKDMPTTESWWFIRMKIIGYVVYGDYACKSWRHSRPTNFSYSDRY